jgi:hypothetical protein
VPHHKKAEKEGHAGTCEEAKHEDWSFFIITHSCSCSNYLGSPRARTHSFQRELTQPYENGISDPNTSYRSHYLSILLHGGPNFSVNFEGANHIQMIAQLEARKIGYMPINWTIYVA